MVNFTQILSDIAANMTLISANMTLIGLITFSVLTVAVMIFSDTNPDSTEKDHHVVKFLIGAPIAAIFFPVVCIGGVIGVIGMTAIACGAEL